MIRKLPLYAERAIGELQATRSYTAVEFERSFREDNGVTCKAGCANCCMYPRVVTIAEAILLYRFLASKGRLTGALRKKIQTHASTTDFLSPAVWMLSNIPCPLLDDDNKCRGYEARPLGCRLTLSTGLPEKCHPNTLDITEMAATRDILPEVAAFETRLLKTHGISTVRMSISRALLIAERVLSGEVRLMDIESIFYWDFIKS